MISSGVSMWINPSSSIKFIWRKPTVYINHNLSYNLIILLTKCQKHYICHFICTFSIKFVYTKLRWIELETYKIYGHANPQSTLLFVGCTLSNLTIPSNHSNCAHVKRTKIKIPNFQASCQKHQTKHQDKIFFYSII